MAIETSLVPKTRRWKRVEYERLVDLGMFEGERLELLDGLLAVREPQGSLHAAGIRRVVSALRRVLDETWQIDCQLPIALDDDSEPEPDVAVVPLHEDAYRTGHPSRPVLVVEVADSSYRIDRHYKMSLYARAAVPEYWVVDVTRQTLEVHRDPTPTTDAAFGWRYARVETLRDTDVITPLIASSAIRVADLLP